MNEVLQCLRHTGVCLYIFNTEFCEKQMVVKKNPSKLEVGAVTDYSVKMQNIQALQMNAEIY